jgi:hypothetical protein
MESPGKDGESGESCSAVDYLDGGLAAQARAAFSRAGLDADGRLAARFLDGFPVIVNYHYRRGRRDEFADTNVIKVIIHPGDDGFANEAVAADDFARPAILVRYLILHAEAHRVAAFPGVLLRRKLNVEGEAQRA